HQPFTERTSIVSACCPDGEDFAAAASEQDLFLIHMTYQHLAVGERLLRDAGLEVWVVRLAGAAHVSPPGDDRDCFIDAMTMRMFRLGWRNTRESLRRSPVKPLGYASVVPTNPRSRP